LLTGANPEKLFTPKVIEKPALNRRFCLKKVDIIGKQGFYYNNMLKIKFQNLS
jgi:hypothetical protein